MTTSRSTGLSCQFIGLILSSVGLYLIYGSLESVLPLISPQPNQAIAGLQSGSVQQIGLNTNSLLSHAPIPPNAVQAITQAFPAIMVTAIGFIFIGSLSPARVGWFYLLNPLGFGLASLLGSPLRGTSTHHRSVGILAAIVGGGLLWGTYRVAFTDISLPIPDLYRAWLILLLAVTGTAMLLAGSARAVFRPFYSRFEDSPKSRFVVSSQVLCGK